jgi:hypothetical protein
MRHETPRRSVYQPHGTRNRLFAAVLKRTSTASRPGSWPAARADESVVASAIVRPGTGPRTDWAQGERASHGFRGLAKALTEYSDVFPFVIGPKPLQPFV